MPKQTFYNLPDEKRNYLIKAMKREFSRVPLNEASIANIVKNADIPRGSFYQYFEDKEDAFYFLLNDLVGKHGRQFITVLQEKDGDIFNTFITIFKKVLTEFKQKENRDFLRHAFLNMNYKMEKKLTENFVKSDVNNQLEKLIAYVDISKLNVDHKSEVVHVLQIATAVTFQNFMHHFAKKYTFDQAVEKYTFQINLLKKGLNK